MDLKVTISSIILKHKGNYFLVVQLDEMEFPSKERKSFKSRTELIPDVAVPRFSRNVFTFENMSLGSRLALKFGVFNSKLSMEPHALEKLLDNSVISGSTALVFTQRILTVLRERPMDTELKIYDRDKLECGRMTINMQFKPHTFEQQIDEDKRKVEKLYYDPLEDDEELIAD
jgi:hypothetical protein